MPSLLLSSLFCLFLVHVTISLDFNVDNSNSKTTMDFSGSAYAADNAIYLTAESTDPDDDSVQTQLVGRATYKESVHLYDKKSNKLADFSTYFKFEISSDTSKYGGGLALFMAPVGSTIPSGSAGGGLGLVNSSKINTTDGSSHDDDRESSFFAVEFDTFLNEWEKSLPIPHVGIDLNSVISKNPIQWSNNVSVEFDNEAWIWYDSDTNTLRVNFTRNAGHENNYNNRSYGNLSYAVDLRKYLPEHVVVGFSASVGNDSANQKIYNWSFNCTDLGGKNGGDLGLVLGLSLSLSSALVLASALVCCRYVRKKTHHEASHEAPAAEGDEDDLIDDPNMDEEFERGSGPKKFSYIELARATSDFSEKENLGEGGFGRVYRGYIEETNSYIAVKRLSRRSRQGLKEYASEVKIISRLRHKNLVQFIGWCHRRGDLLLVYEYMPNGSLDYHLFGRNLIPLSWEVRYKIALGLASAVQYLHEECEQCVLHRDIKSSNVMLDSGFNSKLGDFGLARLVDHDKGSQTTVLAGTMGYMAPEYVITGRASKESDVYSFGVVLLEIACGRRPIDEAEDRQVVTRLIERVWNLYGSRRLLDGADPKLRSMFDAREMETLMVVGLWCVHPDSNYRPTVREANRVLSYEAPWPKLPYVVPQVMYYTPYYSGEFAASNSAGDDRTRIDHCSTSLTTSTAFSRISPR